MDSIKKYDVKVNQYGSFADNIDGENFKLQQFIDFSGHNKEINKCNFSYAVFTRVYFRKVKFTDCDFTGAKFFDSNLRDAEFVNCKFEYSLFKFTIIRPKEVLKNLPEWPNVKTYLLQNHKANSNSLGDIGAVRLYLLQEIEANKEHLRRARKRNERYYSEKYKDWKDQLWVWWKSIVLYFDDLLWGHGESPWRIIINVFFIILFISIIQTIATGLIWKASGGTIVSEFINFYKNDVKAFIGINTIVISDFSKALLILLRYLTMGLFIRILFNKYSWR